MWCQRAPRTVVARKQRLNLVKVGGVALDGDSDLVRGNVQHLQQEHQEVTMQGNGAFSDAGVMSSCPLALATQTK